MTEHRIPIAVLSNLCTNCTAKRANCYQSGPAADNGVTCAAYRMRVRKAEQIPASTIQALPDREPCAECACRPGTQANGTAHTVTTFRECIKSRVPFLCHGAGDGRVCGGWLKASKAMHAIGSEGLVG